MQAKKCEKTLDVSTTKSLLLCGLGGCMILMRKLNIGTRNAQHNGCPSSTIVPYHQPLSYQVAQLLSRKKIKTVIPQTNFWAKERSLVVTSIIFNLRLSNNIQQLSRTLPASTTAQHQQANHCRKKKLCIISLSSQTTVLYVPYQIIGGEKNEKLKNKSTRISYHADKQTNN